MAGLLRHKSGVLLVPKLHLGMSLSAKLYFTLLATKRSEVEPRKPMRSQVQRGNEGKGGGGFFAPEVPVSQRDYEAKPRVDGRRSEAEPDAYPG